MSLLKDLKEKRQDAVENVVAQDIDMEATRATLAEEQRIRDHWTAQIADLDKAIAALEPTPVEPALEWVEPPTADEPDEPAEHISILTGDPAIEPESGLHGERTEDVSQAEKATEQTTLSEAAYAPVNDEGLMWSNGFEADAKAKAAAPEPEVRRPFWMLGKVDA